jgi:hypothetical protein
VVGNERGGGGQERIKQRAMKRGKSKKEVILGTERGKEEEESETNGMKKGIRNWRGAAERGKR